MKSWTLSGWCVWLDDEDLGVLVMAMINSFAWLLLSMMILVYYWIVILT